jgi:hypothetical protein
MDNVMGGMIWIWTVPHDRPAILTRDPGMINIPLEIQLWI